jgi:hypothetical protein
MSTDAAKAVVRRNTEEVQGRGNFEVFEELFADDFVDHTPQPNCTPDKDGARGLYKDASCCIPRFPRRYPLAGGRWGACDDLKDVSWNAPGNIPGFGAHRPKNPL